MARPVSAFLESGQVMQQTEAEHLVEAGVQRTVPPESPRPTARAWIGRAFTAVEDVVYIGLGLLLAASALTLLVNGSIEFAQSVTIGHARTIELLDRILLIL